MPMQKNTIINFYNTWLGLLYAFKDIEFQRRAWFRHEGSEVSSFDDETDYLLDGYDKLIRKYHELSEQTDREQLYSNELLILLKQIYDKVEAYTRSDSIYNFSDEDKFFKDPKWLDIVGLAQKICEILNHRIKEIENEK